MEIAICDHHNEIESAVERGTRSVVAECQRCGQIRQYKDGDKHSAVITHLGRINAAIVMPPAGIPLEVSKEESLLVRAGWDKGQDDAEEKEFQEKQQILTGPTGTRKPTDWARMGHMAKVDWYDKHWDEMLKDSEQMELQSFLSKWGLSKSGWFQIKARRTGEGATDRASERARKWNAPPFLKPEPEPEPEPEGAAEGKTEQEIHERIAQAPAPQPVPEAPAAEEQAEVPTEVVAEEEAQVEVIEPPAEHETPPLAETVERVKTQRMGRPRKYDGKRPGILVDYGLMTVTDLMRKWNIPRGTFYSLKKRWEAQGIVFPAAFADVDDRAAKKGRPRTGESLQCIDCGKPIYVRKYRLDEDPEAEHRCRGCSSKHAAKAPLVSKNKRRPDLTEKKKDNVVRDYLREDKTIIIQMEYKIGPAVMYRILKARQVKLRRAPEPSLIVDERRLLPAGNHFRVALWDLMLESQDWVWDDTFARMGELLAKYLEKEPLATVETLGFLYKEFSPEELVDTAFAILIEYTVSHDPRWEHLADDTFRLRSYKHGE